MARVCEAGCSLGGRMNCTHAAVAGLRLTPRGDTQWVIADPGHREGHASVSPSPAPPSCAVPGIGSWGWPRACTPVRRTCPSTPRARLDLDVSPAIGWRRSRLPPPPSATPRRAGVMSRPATGPTPLCARRGEAGSLRCGGG